MIAVIMTVGLRVSFQFQFSFISNECALLQPYRTCSSSVCFETDIIVFRSTRGQTKSWTTNSWTNQLVDKPIRGQTNSWTSRLVDKPNREQTNTWTIENIIFKGNASDAQVGSPYCYRARPSVRIAVVVMIND